MDMMVLIFGVVLLVIGLVFIIPYKVVSKLKGRTEGVIQDMTINAGDFNNGPNNKFGPVTVRAGVGNRSHFDMKGANAVTYHAVYAYCVNGVTYVRADGVGYNKGQILKKMGQRIPVYYDPENPYKASLSSGRIYKYLSIGLSVLGIVVSIIGLITAL